VFFYSLKLAQHFFCLGCELLTCVSKVSNCTFCKDQQRSQHESFELTVFCNDAEGWSVLEWPHPSLCRDTRRRRPSRVRLQTLFSDKKGFFRHFGHYLTGFGGLFLSSWKCYHLRRKKWLGSNDWGSKYLFDCKQTVAKLPSLDILVNDVCNGARRNISEFMKMFSFCKQSNDLDQMTEDQFNCLQMESFLHFQRRSIKIGNTIIHLNASFRQRYFILYKVIKIGFAFRIPPFSLFRSLHRGNLLMWEKQCSNNWG